MKRCSVSRHPVAWGFAVAFAACASDNAPVPVSLRGAEYPLVRVDGRPVRGSAAAATAPASLDVTADCRSQVSDGALRIDPRGRTFTYRSTMRDCRGHELVTETNEGTVDVHNDGLAFVIWNSSGPVTFRGAWTDSSVVIEQLGGRLEFSRR